MSFIDTIELVLNNREHVTVDNFVKGARIVGKDGYESAESFVKGARTVETQMINGIWRTIEGWNVLNSDRQMQIAGENEAFVALIDTSVRAAGKGLTNPITYVVVAAIDGFMRSLPEEPLMRMSVEITGKVYLKHKGKDVAKVALQKALQKQIIHRIVTNKAFKALAKKLGMAAGVAETGIGLPIALLLTQGFLQEASKASRRLQALDPVLFAELRGAPPSLGSQIQRSAYTITPFAKAILEHIRARTPNQQNLAKPNKKPAGFDMLYVLAEPYLRPYIAASVIARNNKEVIVQIMNSLDKSKS